MPENNPTDETRGMHRVPDHETSIEAAEAVLPSRQRMKALVYLLLAEKGPQTDEELTSSLRALGIHAAHSSAGKRRGDLVDDGVVVDSGDRRPNVNGRRMIVWRVADLLDLAAEAPTGGFVPEYVTDSIAGHEGDQP